MKSTLLRLLTVVMLLVSSGCAHQILVSPNPAASTATGEKLPLNVGLYMSDAFRNYQVSESRMGDSWQYTNLGQASAQQIRAGLEQRFQTVTLLQSRAISQANPQPVMVVEPEIQSFTFDIPITKFQVYPATIRFKVSVIGTSGEVIYSNTTSGVGDTSGSPGFDFAANPARSATKAVEVGINDLLNDLAKSPAVQKLLQAPKTSPAVGTSRVL